MEYYRNLSWVKKSPLLKRVWIKIVTESCSIFFNLFQNFRNESDTSVLLEKVLQHAENGILVAENSTFEKESDGDFFSCLVLPGVWIVSNHHLKTADFYTNTRIVDSELNYIRNLLRVFLVCKLNMRSFGSVMCYEHLMLPLEHQGVSLMLVCCVGKARWCIWQSCQLKNEGKSSLKFLYFSVHYEQNFKNLYDL